MYDEFFEDIPDEEGLVCVKRSKTGDVVVGLYPVIYGVRLRAGYAGQRSYYIDWCCGDQQGVTEGGYGMLLSILVPRLQLPHPFFAIPTFSDIKPFPKDPRFVEKITQLAGEWFPVPLPPMVKIRERSGADKFLENFFN